MNWFDAERIVLDRHDEAWKAMKLYGAEERPYRSRSRAAMIALGTLMVRWGMRLQAVDQPVGELQVYSNGRAHGTPS